MIKFANPYYGNQEDLEKEMTYTLAQRDRISNGESCRKLEERVAKISGADYAMSCSSGTQALIIMLGASGTRGQPWCPSFTWISTAYACKVQGGVQVMMRDIDRTNWIVPHYKVSADPKEGGFVLAVDTFGMEFQPISYLPIFYDRAHSLGVKFKTLGVASMISFSPSKIVTAGEGGMILTNKQNFADAMLKLRDVMSRMPETNATLALHNIRYLPELLEWKEETYDLYKHAFPQFQFQEGGPTNHHVIGMLLDSKEQRDKVFDALKDIVEFKIYYEPLHLQNPQSPPLKVTEEIYDRILCLPSWYKVDREFIVEKIRGVLE